MARGTIVTTTTKDGTKRYKTVIRIGGKQQWRTWDKKGDAEAYLDGLSPEVRDGTYRNLKKGTFAEYVAIWRASHLLPQQFKPSTYNGLCSILEYHLLPEFKPYPMQAISSTEVNAFIAKLLKGDPDNKRKAVGKNTVRNILNLLDWIFARSIKDSYLRFSPMAGVDRPTVDKGTKGRALKPDEIQSILQACSARFRPIFATAVATGMRRGEQFGLDWENLDWDNDIIKIRRSLCWLFGKYHNLQDGDQRYTFVVPKSKYSVRDIDLSPGLRSELRKMYLKGGRKGLVFCTSTGTPLNPDNVKRTFQKTLQRAEVERAKNNLPAIGKVHWHDLRHTYGSLKIDQGEDLLYVSRQMGHGSTSITADVYAHQLRERRPESAAKTDAAIFGR